MNESELKKGWQATQDKLEAAFAIDHKMTDDITRLKVHNFLGTMKPVKIFTLLAGFLWVAAGSGILSRIYLQAFAEANKFFLFSATAQILLTAMALFIYLFQLIQIYQVEISDPIVKTQKKLTQLRVSTLWSVRILFLQLPLWTIFWWNESMLRDWNPLQWAVAGLVTASFTYAALWLFFNIKYEHRDKKWFKLLFSGKEWTPLMQSMEILTQLEAVEEEKPGL